MSKAKQERIRLAIKQVISDLMDRVMDRVLISDPFIKEKHRSSKPLYAALVPDECLFAKSRNDAVLVNLSCQTRA